MRYHWKAERRGRVRRANIGQDFHCHSGLVREGVVSPYDVPGIERISAFDIRQDVYENRVPEWSRRVASARPLYVFGSAAP